MPKKQVIPAPRDGSHLVMVWPDIHFPHQDNRAVGCAMAIHDALKPEKTVFLGDGLDCESFSRHPKGSLLEDRAASYFRGEIVPMTRLLNFCETNTGEIAYLAGNHEHRVERSVVDLGHLGAGIAELVSPKRLLSEDRKVKWTYIDYVPKPGAPLPHYKIARDLIAIHGWSFARHAAANHLALARSYSVVHGHTHRAQMYTAKDPITSRRLQAWSPGCLSKLQPLYMAHNPTDWVHGVSLVWVRNDGSAWTSYDVAIKGGIAVLPGGIKVDGADKKWQKVMRDIVKK